MKKLFALTDYKNSFGSKWKAKPYRSGYDKKLLKKYFYKYGYEVKFIKMQDVKFDRNIWEGENVIYTSSEEIGLNYKDFIEDIIYGLELCGANVIPRYSMLRANNNKVFMEILRYRILGEELSGNKSMIFGTYEELKIAINNNKLSCPCVIKKSTGAMSRGVFLANNFKELKTIAKKTSRTRNIIYEFKDFIRKHKHKSYKKESKYQNKFIVQKFIPNLENDWKIVIYGDHYYILKRYVRENDFRASGSHVNYKAGSESEFPFQMLDTIEKIYKKLDIPHLSLDFAFDGKRGYVHEIQAIHFGTSTQYISNDFYIKKNNKWTVLKKEFDQEEEYVWGIVKYLGKHSELL